MNRLEYFSMEYYAYIFFLISGAKGVIKLEEKKKENKRR